VRRTAGARAIAIWSTGGFAGGAHDANADTNAPYAHCASAIYATPFRTGRAQCANPWHSGRARRPSGSRTGRSPSGCASYSGYTSGAHTGSSGSSC
jgi:hypothetical protein